MTFLHRQERRSERCDKHDDHDNDETRLQCTVVLSTTHQPKRVQNQEREGTVRRGIRDGDRRRSVVSHHG